MPSVAPPTDDITAEAILAPPLSTSDDSKPSSRNFFVLVLYQVVMRTGWIFKTESIIMPAVLDSLGGGAWLRSCLPLLNRFGQSVPPLIMARQVNVRPRKKWIMFLTTMMMALPFLSLSGIWATQSTNVWWMPIVFLFFYMIFFASTGINQLTFATLQGKLISPHRRGRLMLVANVFGAMTAIGCAAWLLPYWLREDGASFQYIFGVAGICFVGAALCAAALNEGADRHVQARQNIRQIFFSAYRILQTDTNFRRTALVASLFGCSMMLFPHYQALGRQRLDLKMDSLIGWVILQNAGTAVFSFVVGPLADRRGNRLVLQVVLLLICVSPLAALALTYWPAVGSLLYSGVFVLVGLTPVAIRIFSNYTLELAQRSDHPRYLSTLSICLAFPVMLSPLVGLLVDLIGFDIVFCTIAGLIAIGWLASFRLFEPRRQAHTA